MPTNFYLHNFPVNQITQEQLLVEDLVIEALQWSGMDVYYMPSSNDSEIDYLFGDHQLKQYTYHDHMAIQCTLRHYNTTRATCRLNVTYKQQE